jgi:hypothetical protein
VRRRGARAVSSEAETRPRGRQALERGGDLPEGYHGRPFDGSLRLFGPWALLCFGPQPRRVCFVVCEFVCLFTFYYFFERGVFPVFRGPSWLSRTHMKLDLSESYAIRIMRQSALSDMMCILDKISRMKHTFTLLFKFKDKTPFCYSMFKHTNSECIFPNPTTNMHIRMKNLAATSNKCFVGYLKYCRALQ